MIKLKWGSKRQCLGCGIHFYDLQRSPIVCPQCGIVYEIQGMSKSRKRAATDLEKNAVLSDESTVLDLDTDLDTEITPDDDIIEDTSELGEDIDDMSTVMDHVDEESDR